MEEGANSEQTAKYNEGFLQTQRLHEIWLRCNRHQSDGNLLKLKWEIMNGWIELSSAAKKLEEQGKEYSKGKSWIQKMEDYQKELSNVKNREQMHKILFDMMLFLRLLQDKSGKGTKWVDADEDDID